MKVFYSPQQSVKKSNRHSPSASKPKLLVEAWQAVGFPIEIVEPKPCTKSQIALAHSTDYVRGVMSQKIPNGFGTQEKEVSKSLLWTSGSLVSASIEAWTHKTATMSPTSGFHHACYDSGGAFCTFNGLIVAAQMLRLRGAKKVGILDCDQHAGNGTENIIEKLDLNYIEHWSLGYSDIWSAKVDEWLKEFPTFLRERFSDVEVLIYQAGADPHIEDPLGGRMTTEQMRLRDQIVFEFAKENGIGICWNLAGGYQDPIGKVLELHTNTLKECLKVFNTLDKFAKSA